MLHCFFAWPNRPKPWKPHSGVLEAVEHARAGRYRQAIDLLAHVFVTANDDVGKLQALNCYCSLVDRRVYREEFDRYIKVQLTLCERVGKADPLACVMGYSGIGRFHLLAFRHTEALQMFELAERVLSTCHEHAAVLMKRILQGRIQAHMEMYRLTPEPLQRDHILGLFRRLEKEGNLNNIEQAALHMLRAEAYLMCYSNYAMAAQERGAMFIRLGRAFEPTCSICLGDMCIDSGNTLFLGCFHALHRDCFARIAPVLGKPTLKRCPLCRYCVRTLLYEPCCSQA